MIGLGIAIPKIAVNGTKGSLESVIRRLFANGEPGAWYDPSDLTTLYQDAAGTTPVTAVEQPVGLMLDKSKGLVLGPELIAQPVNFNANWIATPGGAPVASGSSFTTSSIGGFWINVLTPGKTYQVTVNGSTIAASGVTLRQTDTTTTSQIRAGFGSAVFTAQSGFTYFYVRNESAGTTTVTSISVRELPGAHASQTTATSRPVLSARYSLCVTSEFPSGTSDAQLYLGFVSSSLTGYQGALSCTNLSGPAYAYKTTGLPTSAGLFRMRAVVQMSDGLAPLLPSTDPLSALNDFMFVIGGNYAAATLGEEISPGVFEVFGVLQTSAGNNGRYGIQRISGSARRGFVVTAYDVRPANQAGLPYQRVNTATDYDAGPAYPRYLRCDGIDDGMVTGTITPGTDKAQVFAGVRSLAGGQYRALLEMSANADDNVGTFLMSGNGNLSTYRVVYVSRGTATAGAFANNTAYNPPVTLVQTGVGDISGDRASLRVNGTQAASSTADQGTGNFNPYPLYLFRRGGTTLPFNGHFYGAVIRFGDNLPIETIQQTEAYMAAKTGVTL